MSWNESAVLALVNILKWFISLSDNKLPEAIQYVVRGKERAMKVNKKKRDGGSSREGGWKHS